MMSDQIPTIGTHRGIALHADQDAKRLRIVKSELNLVLDVLHDPLSLLDFAADPAHAPESRMAAGAKCKALLEVAQAERRTVAVRVKQLDAATAGLDSVMWRSPWRYCCLLEDHLPGGVKRDVPLGDDPLSD
jgi:hypothetical protein